MADELNPDEFEAVEPIVDPTDALRPDAPDALDAFDEPPIAIPAEAEAPLAPEAPPATGRASKAFQAAMAEFFRMVEDSRARLPEPDPVLTAEQLEAINRWPEQESSVYQALPGTWESQPDTIRQMPHRFDEPRGSAIQLLGHPSLADDDGVRGESLAGPRSGPVDRPSLQSPTANGGPPLARPIVLVTLTPEANRQIVQETTESAAKRDYQVLRDVTRQEIDHAFWWQAAQRRSILGDY